MSEGKITFIALGIIGTLLLVVINAFAGGLLNEVKTPITGEIITYDRARSIMVGNELNQYPWAEFTTERVTVFPNGQYKQDFKRRVKLNAQEYSGVDIPRLNPLDGTEIGTITVDGVYADMYSLFVFAELEADRKQMQANNPDKICYTTNGQVICQ